MDGPRQRAHGRGMSKNSLRIWDIESARDIIGFDPEDGAGETWTDRPGERGANP